MLPRVRVRSTEGDQPGRFHRRNNTVHLIPFAACLNRANKTLPLTLGVVCSNRWKHPSENLPTSRCPRSSVRPGRLRSQLRLMSSAPPSGELPESPVADHATSQPDRFFFRVRPETPYDALGRQHTLSCPLIRSRWQPARISQETFPQG